VETASPQLVGLISHGTAVVAFLLLGALSIFNWKSSRIGVCLVGASTLTALWAAARVLGGIDSNMAAFALPMETLRTGSWILFLTVLLKTARQNARAVGTALWLPPMLLGLAGILFGAELVDAVLQYDLGPMTVSLPTISVHLMLAIGGLLLVENLFRNAVSEARWGIKYLCLGLGAFFVYDLYLYANGLLFQNLNPWLLDARGLTNAAIVPLIAVSAARNPEWKVDLFVSRRLAFYSATLMASGGYLLLMAMTGYYLREFGGNWGNILLVAFLFGSMLLLVIILFSGRFRTQVRVFVSKHFFNYKYDYREEWLRFISTMSGKSGAGLLQERAIQAVADIVESPGGLLFLEKGADRFAVVARWNMPDLPLAREPADSPFSAFLRDRQWIIDFHQMDQDPEMYDGLPPPDWVADAREPWLVVPLCHHDRLVGFLLLQEARARHSLNWEDHDILKTVGSQVASYLAEQSATLSLVEARQFEAFNRRFAFVLHDIKNLVSQLSLMTANAEKHAGNPEFQRDMLLTVQESVSKMKGLLERLHGTAVSQAGEGTDVITLLEGTAERKKRAGVAVILNAPGERLMVRGEADSLANVFEHVIQNAQDAMAEAGTGAPVTIDVVERQDKVEVVVTDQGTGMDEDFVRNQLFRPFRSTKTGGYGIGAYESREIVREAGGEFDVDSAPGRGTRIIIRLGRPLADGAALRQFELEEK
jgi:putative PEP-CTERM system histidine kinase